MCMSLVLCSSLLPRIACHNLVAGHSPNGMGMACLRSQVKMVKLLSVGWKCFVLEIAHSASLMSIEEELLFIA